MNKEFLELDSSLLANNKERIKALKYNSDVIEAINQKNQLRLTSKMIFYKEKEKRKLKSDKSFSKISELWLSFSLISCVLIEDLFTVILVLLGQFELAIFSDVKLIGLNLFMLISAIDMLRKNNKINKEYLEKQNCIDQDLLFLKQVYDKEEMKSKELCESIDVEEMIVNNYQESINDKIRKELDFLITNNTNEDTKILKYGQK